jgi:Na+-driven multidrug efflux pump
MAGLLVLLIGVVYLLADLTDLDVNGRWIGPGVLLAVGAAGLLATLRSRDADRDLDSM